mmetsp:Transcript_26937/g.69858  ORF Transcript_26937/g.69858 Transcript_26937/m.69858 type:complete len:433 (+) Transcript_26937:116-1414(+)
MRPWPRARSTSLAHEQPLSARDVYPADGAAGHPPGAAAAHARVPARHHHHLDGPREADVAVPVAVVLALALLLAVAVAVLSCSLAHGRRLLHVKRHHLARLRAFRPDRVMRLRLPSIHIHRGRLDVSARRWLQRAILLLLCRLLFVLLVVGGVLGSDASCVVGIEPQQQRGAHLLALVLRLVRNARLDHVARQHEHAHGDAGGADHQNGDLPRCDGAAAAAGLGRAAVLPLPARMALAGAKDALPVAAAAVERGAGVVHDPVAEARLAALHGRDGHVLPRARLAVRLEPNQQVMRGVGGAAVRVRGILALATLGGPEVAVGEEDSRRAAGERAERVERLHGRVHARVVLEAGCKGSALRAAAQVGGALAGRQVAAGGHHALRGKLLAGGVAELLGREDAAAGGVRQGHQAAAHQPLPLLLKAGDEVALLGTA